MRRLAQALGTTVDFLNGDSRDTPETDNQSVPQRSLSDVIFAAREQVAIAAGVPVRKVRMIIDCGD